jgi:hypothetical protein
MSASSLWTEDSWDQLLPSIEERRVVPIIGRDLLQVTPNGGPPVRLDEFVAGSLATELGVTVPGEPTLNGVVCAYLAVGGRWAKLYSRVREIMERAQLAPPLVLRQLAEITDFSLFLTMNFDLLLEQAIDRVRFDGQPGTVSLSYAPTKQPPDLATAVRSLPHPVVYHLLGVQSPTPSSYVLCDEDLLEFVYGLQAPNRRPERLFEELEDQHLLLLGEGFSDWLTRLFLRTARSSGRLSDRRKVMEFMAETRSSDDTGLFQFLRAFSSASELYPGGAAEFVDELHRRWMARRPARSAAARPKRAIRPAAAGKDVFISYASEDRVAASVLKQELEDAGCSVWIDMRQLPERSGYMWETEIKTNIKSCALFMPVLSASTEGRAEGYFREEWQMADARTKRQFASDRPFILPVVVDDTHGIHHVPDSFRAAQMVRLPGGRFTEGFAAQLHAMLDEVITDEDNAA